MTLVTEAEQAETGQPTSVLVVEDEPSAREASQLYLTRCGYNVQTAANADDAIEKARKDTPDVLVCDWRLGRGADGVYVARQLQKLHDIPVIFVTAHPMDELRDASRGIRVAFFMRKPISLISLAQAIDAAAA
jgi:CheY-like chemotaxis protein